MFHDHPLLDHLGRDRRVLWPEQQEAEHERAKKIAKRWARRAHRRLWLREVWQRLTRPSGA